MTSNSLLATPDNLMMGVIPASTLVVFDRRVSDIETLSQALLPGSIGFTIGIQDDGLERITELLAATGAKYLSVVAHGESGVVFIGRNSIDIEQLQLQSHLLQQWGVQEIALYSCEVAKDDIGKDFVYQLSELTGATVTAAETKIGSAEQGGNWDLAVTTGEVTAPIVFKASVLQTYQAVLADVSFSTAGKFALPSGGNGPNDIAIGDFNGDGKLDIVTERYANSKNNVLILLGDGTGSFGAPRNFAISTGNDFNSYALAVADFNGDNKLDVVTANSDGNTVSVLLGDGAGNIGAARKFTTGGLGQSAPWKVVVGDFNNDGKLDLATANQYGNNSGGNFSVLLGDGIGGFSAPTTFSTPGSDGIYAIALGDFNKDGKLDAVTSKYVPFVGYFLSTFLGNGAGGFGVPTDTPLGNSAPSLAVADFNGDGNLDVAAALSSNGNAVAVLLGDGVGGFGAATNFAVNSASRVKTGDFNGDGIIDLAVTSYSGNNSVSVLLGNGSGGFGAATSFAVGSSPSLALGDFNNDGKLDFAAANYNDKNVVIGLNTSTPTPTPTPITRNDFNGDGKSDILWRNTNGNVALWQMNGSNLTTGSVFANVSTAWTIASTGDFNGDNKSDILWRNTDGQVAIWQMNGATPTTQAVIGSVPTNWQISGTGDFNGDRKADILWRNTTDGSVAIWQMNGTTATAQTVVGAATTDWQIAGTDDFNGDGKADILWRNDNGDVAMWQMNGTTPISQTVFANVSTDWKIAGSGDFNGDGKADILWRNDNGSVAIWAMNGSTALSKDLTTPYPTIDNSWKIAGTSDFNGDGKADIFWRNTDGSVETWLMNGSTVTAANLVSPNSIVDSSWNIASPIL